MADTEKKSKNRITVVIPKDPETAEVAEQHAEEATRCYEEAQEKADRTIMACKARIDAAGDDMVQAAQSFVKKLKRRTGTTELRRKSAS